jgi:Bacteriophage T7, probable scaffold protein Gp13
MLRFRAATASDARLLSTRLRRSDSAEIWAAVGRDAESVLVEGVAASDPCWAVISGGDAPIALFGVVPDSGQPGSGMVWLLGSDELENNSIGVLRLSSQWVERLHERYDYLWNYIDARNESHIDWLRWCGFHLVERIERHGFEQRPFWRFERHR